MNSNEGIEKEYEHDKLKVEEELENEIAQVREAIEIEHQKEEGADEGPIDTKND